MRYKNCHLLTTKIIFFVLIILYLFDRNLEICLKTKTIHTKEKFSSFKNFLKKDKKAGRPEISCVK